MPRPFLFFASGFNPRSPKDCRSARWGAQAAQRKRETRLREKPPQPSAGTGCQDRGRRVGSGKKGREGLGGEFRAAQRSDTRSPRPRVASGRQGRQAAGDGSARARRLRSLRSPRSPQFPWRSAAPEKAAANSRAILAASTRSDPLALYSPCGLLHI